MAKHLENSGKVLWHPVQRKPFPFLELQKQKRIEVMCQGSLYREKEQKKSSIQILILGKFDVRMSLESNPKAITASRWEK